jgi:ATP-dependent DNA helicase RecG
MTYPDAELEALLSAAESDLSERKESLGGDAPTKIREAICAFANDLPDHQRAGVVFVGAEDNGAPSGLAITDQLLLTLGAMKSDGNIVPPPSMIVEKRVLRGVEMAIVTVAPADAPPVSYQGRIWIRVGPQRAIATAQDERILSEKRRFRDKTFDAHPLSSAKLSDLSRTRFEEDYLPAAVARDVLESNDRTYEQRLTATKMVLSPEEPIPTVAGMLVLGTRPRDFLPGAYVQFLRINGTALSDPIRDEGDIDGPIADVIRRVEEKLEAHNQTAVDITGGPIEVRTPTYPLPALQQLLRNSILHRSYEGTNAPVRVTWFDDRIEITNPGGPYGAVTAARFGTPGLVDYRNPVLAEAMKVMGFVNRFGVGIATAREALEKNGNPQLEFSVEPEWILATVRRRP